MASRAPWLVAACATAGILAVTLLWRDRAREPSLPGAVAPAASQPRPGPPQSANARGLEGPTTMTPAARAAIANIVATRQREQQDRRESMAKRWDAALRSYERERRDPGWAAAKERELRGIADADAMRAAGVEPPGDLVVSCRQSLCQTEVEFASTASAEDWLLGYMSSVGSASSRSFVRREPLPQGGVRVRIVSQAR